MPTSTGLRLGCGASRASHVGPLVFTVVGVVSAVAKGLCPNKSPSVGARTVWVQAFGTVLPLAAIVQEPPSVGRESYTGFFCPVNRTEFVCLDVFSHVPLHVMHGASARRLPWPRGSREISRRPACAEPSKFSSVPLDFIGARDSSSRGVSCLLWPAFYFYSKGPSRRVLADWRRYLGRHHLHPRGRPRVASQRHETFLELSLSTRHSVVYSVISAFYFLRIATTDLFVARCRSQSLLTTVSHVSGKAFQPPGLGDALYIPGGP